MITKLFLSCERSGAIPCGGVLGWFWEGLFEEVLKDSIDVELWERFGFKFIRKVGSLLIGQLSFWQISELDALVLAFLYTQQPEVIANLFKASAYYKVIACFKFAYIR